MGDGARLCKPPECLLACGDGLLDILGNDRLRTETWAVTWVETVKSVVSGHLVSIFVWRRDGSIFYALGCDLLLNQEINKWNWKGLVQCLAEALAAVFPQTVSAYIDITSDVSDCPFWLSLDLKAENTADWMQCAYLALIRTLCFLKYPPFLPMPPREPGSVTITSNMNSIVDILSRYLTNQLFEFLFRCYQEGEYYPYIRLPYLSRGEMFFVKRGSVGGLCSTLLIVRRAAEGRCTVQAAVCDRSGEFRAVDVSQVGADSYNACSISEIFTIIRSFNYRLASLA